MTITYPDALYGPAILKAIEEAETYIEIMVYVFRTDYVGDVLPKRVRDALKAAAARGVKVLIIFNYSRFEPDLCSINYQVARELHEAGCKVRMGPRNQTFHTKLAIFDLSLVFIGSHNWTRGGLQFNGELTVYSNTLEMRQRAIGYFGDTQQKRFAGGKAVWHNGGVTPRILAGSR